MILANSMQCTLTRGDLTRVSAIKKCQKSIQEILGHGIPAKENPNEIIADTQQFKIKIR